MILLRSTIEFNEELIKRGYSKRDFARKSGVSVATLIQISNGKQLPRPATTKKICEALECEFDELFVIAYDKNLEQEAQT